ncbi:hypothetical protein ACFXTI_005416 [Malus domestica]
MVKAKTNKHVDHSSHLPCVPRSTLMVYIIEFRTQLFQRSFTIQLLQSTSINHITDSFMMIIILLYDEVMPNDASPQNPDPPTPDIRESSLAEGVHRPSDKDDGRGDQENVSIDYENIISHLGDDDGRIHSLPHRGVDRDDFVVPFDHRNRSTLVVGRHDHEANLKLPLYTNPYSKLLAERYDRTKRRIIVLYPNSHFRQPSSHLQFNMSSSFPKLHFRQAKQWIRQTRQQHHHNQQQQTILVSRLIHSAFTEKLKPQLHQSRGACL